MTEQNTPEAVSGTEHGYAMQRALEAEPEAPAERPTASEVYDSLTGWDEIAIRTSFGGDISEWVADEDGTTLAERRGNPNMFGRALAFVLERRRLAAAGGTTGPKLDAEAKRNVLDMPMSRIGELFGDEPGEVNPDEPVTEPGKDDS